MLTEVARVVAVDHDSLWVESIRKSTCGSCAAQKGCGHGLLNQLYAGRKNFVRVLPGRISPKECNVDDQVRIAIPESALLRGSAIAYLLPLVILLAGAVLGSMAPGIHQDLGAALGAIVGLGVAFLVVRWHSNRHKDNTDYQPTLEALVQSSGSRIQLLQ